MATKEQALETALDLAAEFALALRPASLAPIAQEYVRWVFDGGSKPQGSNSAQFTQVIRDAIDRGFKLLPGGPDKEMRERYQQL